jgi:uncharacterized protein YndB with AHSA1/START domain
VPNRIDKEIKIAASPDRVWAVITTPESIGEWFGMGKPPELDLRPGGLLKLDFGPNGVFPNVIVTVDPPRAFSYRVASGFPGEAPTEENSTLVEFSLEPDGDGTVLHLSESGFDNITMEPTQPQSAAFESHEQGWPYALERIGTLAEKSAA